jgi:steroid 5-alpha reductase family enzyme
LHLECKSPFLASELSFADVVRIHQARLTFNYWRKGGYSIGSEDYRWELLRQYIPPFLFFVFNVLFISLVQSVLLFSITTPTYLLLLASRLASASGSPVESWTFGDLIISRLMVACVLVCLFADQQQWNFQNAKKSYQKIAKVPAKFDRDDLDRGFIVSGLWGWSRHPNFAAEQAFWLTLYQWACYTTNSIYNWTGLGALAYLILFQASTWFTELVSAGKYPDYKEYQARVGKFVPRLGTEPQGNWKVPRQAKEAIEKVGEELDKDATKARERDNLR